MFHIGQRVVCIDDGGIVPPDAPLARGNIYTVREFTSDHDAASGFLGINLVELPSRVNWPGYSVNRFRPVVNRRTDISIFTELLTPSRPRVLELAGDRTDGDHDKVLS